MQLVTIPHASEDLGLTYREYRSRPHTRPVVLCRFVITRHLLCLPESHIIRDSGKSVKASGGRTSGTHACSRPALRGRPGHVVRLAQPVSSIALLPIVCALIASDNGPRRDGPA